MEDSLPDDGFTSRNVANRRPSSSRIHFPSNNQSLTRQGRLRSELPKTPSSMTPPVRRGSPLNPQKVHQATDLGRRPRSFQADMPVASTDSPLRQKRKPSIGLGDTTRDLDLSADEALEVGVFSNEYDLSHEDPRILQDVQRALKLKARREARLKQKNVASSTDPKQTSVATRSQTPALDASPARLELPSSFSLSPSRKLSISLASDVDFSPSTTIPELSVQPSHPIPSSLDNGITLDWTGTLADDADRRWTISIGKKKEKDKLPPLGTMMDQQDHLHKEKLSRINSLASSQTISKASITSEQLGRRYRLIYESLASNQVPLNLVQMARWFETKDELVRESLEKAEPFTWLKHLDKGTSKSFRSSWHLSALIMEEYVHAQNLWDRMQAISENSANLESKSHSPRKSQPPSFLSQSRTGLINGLGSPKSTNLMTAGISFEPKATRTASKDTASRKSTNSAFSTIATGSSISGVAPLSPVSTRLNDFVETAVDRHKTIGDASSSNSPEASDNGQPQRLMSVPDVSLQPPSSDNVAARHSANPLSLFLSNSTGSLESTNPPPVHTVSSENQSLSSIKSSSKPRRIRMSLHTSRPGRRVALQEDSEESLRLEYEAKATLLQESIAHNHKIRQLLNRISVAVKEYDAIQNVAYHTLNIDQPYMPRDLLEAFGHDPSAVTGSTRRLRGWRAVEDINQRLTRQRNVLKSFRNPLENASTSGCLLDESITNLLQAFEKLESDKNTIALRAVSVLNLLNSVQEVHADVKENYKVTVSRASVVYPELSHIIALEETYQDQYQHFWELGMDALTLLLDTVTPFWRTHGKTIGEDVRDFLIIPLYRNEFTGETKRYPIEEIPRRSLRHWLGLVCFFFLSIGINILQVRAAISSSLHFRLRLIPYDGIRWTALPFFWIGILVQWLAVVFEFAIVFMQVGVITWWTGWSVKVLS